MCVNEMCKSGVGLHEALCPMVFAFTGDGNVSKGARDIFQLLPHEFVSPSDLPHLPKDTNRLFATTVTARHMVQRRISSGSGSGSGGGSGGEEFNTSDYYSNPQNYEPIFHKTIAPYTSVLVNGMYWDPRFPRLLTIEQMKALHRIQPNKLLTVADISCDIEGSVCHIIVQNLRSFH